MSDIFAPLREGLSASGSGPVSPYGPARSSGSADTQYNYSAAPASSGSGGGGGGGGSTYTGPTGLGSGGGGYSGDTGGGGGGGGGTSADGTPVFNPDGKTDDEIADYIRTHYPQYGLYLGIDEVRNVMITAIRGHYDEGQTQAAIANTNWWKQHSAATREWEFLQYSDPAEAQRQLDSKAQAIGRVYSTLGVTNVPQADIYAQAREALSTGLSDADLNGYLGPKLRQYGLGGASGGLSEQGDQVQSFAHSQLVYMTDEQARSFAVSLFDGSMTMDTVKGIITDMARKSHPEFDAELSRGMTIADAMQPVTSTVAGLLEKPTNDIDLLSPKYSVLWQHQDQGSNQIRPMTVAEAATWARHQDDWKTTTNANQQADQTINGLLKTMGAKA